MLASRALGSGAVGSNDNGWSPLQPGEPVTAFAPIGAWSCDLRNDRLTWTGGVFEIFGLATDRTPDRRATLDMYCEESRELLEWHRARAIETCSCFAIEARILRTDGSERWMRITAATQHVGGRAEALFGMKQDITEDRARWDLLRAQAECDALTGLANRVPFQRFLDQPSNAPALSRVGALLLLDMDGFKKLNDGWGHAAGDACLVALGKRLRLAFPHADLISRIGGDEFAILLPPTRSQDRTEAQVRSAINTLIAPVVWDGHRLPIGLSAGLAFVSPDIEADPQHLFIAADQALYSSKASRSGGLI